jgi:hypothetical protein
LNHTAWKEADSSNAYEEEQFYWRNRFIEDCLNEITARPIQFHQDISTDDPTFNTPPVISKSKMKPLRLGPVFLYPSSTTTAPQVTASDIKILNTDIVSTIVLSYTEGKIHICIEVEPILPYFNVHFEVFFSSSFFFEFIVKRFEW